VYPNSTTITSPMTSDTKITIARGLVSQPDNELITSDTKTHVPVCAIGLEKRNVKLLDVP
jgi:hypothetical protein